MAPVPLFESEYILCSTASRSATVMDWWLDGYASEIATKFIFFVFFIFFFFSNTTDFSTGMSGWLHRARYVMFDERDLFYFSFLLVPFQWHIVKPLYQNSSKV